MWLAKMKTERFCFHRKNNECQILFKKNVFFKTPLYGSNFVVYLELKYSSLILNMAHTRIRKTYVIYIFFRHVVCFLDNRSEVKYLLVFDLH